MESKINTIEHLLKQSIHFDSQNNFHHYVEGLYGKEEGSEKQDWFDWKTRAINVILSVMSEDSPSYISASSYNKPRDYGTTYQYAVQTKEDLEIALNNTKNALLEDKYGELKQEKSISRDPTLSNKVFIVHGHDETLKTDVERFIHEIGLEPVVLHRQVDNGNTVIEKFEENSSDIGYAFILLTPDELAYTVDQKDLPDEDRKTELRARPNVIFEFGYFVGKLTRKRVCCLLKGGVSMPSDLAGVVYKNVDNGVESVGLAVMKQLRTAGYKINF
ncbi:hypothetical protein SOPP22_10925 [Shewanella sp. OPT22]|nr:hypothetical protein SOPP22_10925 [Shewanella sp. OPT22]